MLRRIIAIVLTVTAIVVLFSACKSNNGDETSTDPLTTSDTAVASTSESTTTTAPSTTGVTYVLTTNQNKQAPWYSTTRFVPSAQVNGTVPSASQGQTSMSNNYDNITYPTGGEGVITPPVSAVTSAAKTTVWSTISSTTGDADDENEDATTTTAAPDPKAKQVIINSTWMDGSGNFCAAVDSEGWGKIKSNSMRIPVYIDGIEADKPATLQISSSVDGDGCQYVFVNLSKYDVLEFGGSVSFTIPEGFLKNSSGTKYNYACEVSM